jgi:hypothetical protein
MRQVKTQIIRDLINALHEANMADCNDGEFGNDLDRRCASQRNLFGHIAEALKILDEQAYTVYCETGDRPEPTQD